MPAERRYAGRCEGRPVCSAAVFFVMACRRRKCCRRAKRWLRGDMPGGLFGRTVGAPPGRFGCRFVRSPILRRRLFGGRFVRLPIRSGSVFCRGGWPVLGFAGFPGRFSRRRLRRCQKCVKPCQARGRSVPFSNHSSSLPSVIRPTGWSGAPNRASKSAARRSASAQSAVSRRT